MINNWLNKLERKYRRFGINNLMAYIVGLMALVYVASLAVPGPAGVIPGLMLHPQLVLQGEVWRLVTFLFIPPSARSIFVIIVLYLYYIIGTALENEWGSFKFTLYYLIGAVGTIAASFLTDTAATSQYINLSLFLAFASLYPDFQLRLFFMIPIKIKYLAILSGVFLGFNLLFSPMPQRIFIIVALLNFILFFGEYFFKTVTRRTKAAGRKREFMSKARTREGPFHRCVVCGRTEEDDPQLEFRYCSKCEGDYEYCMEHLKNHEHVRNNGNNN
ncbi:rhomboid family intramembrane serine protease [Natranaerobius thermophilus]|uniref:Uncharacterized protein n=1 Tax=Natranaerobius thermophilus (strain ATCC BAA-1301 / DSM 18059 / JW/NM-WN-LF) TaxID=457570 RepID=B2A6T1_NATTJ|nr:rhomboid family intramembrane serine protease [Natranaerobius thermophilus]ACB84212.1 conserved hypothetical protein [Natranaerobius thermophilus JW/NM-WN-LF]